MVKSTLKKLLISKQAGDIKLGAMGEKDKSKLERKWDIEHAYYSSVLEGSKLDKKEFEQLAKEVK